MKCNKRTLFVFSGILFAAIGFNWALNHPEVGKSILSWLFGLVSPLLLGGAIAFVLNVPMRRIEKTLFSTTKKIPRTVQRVLAYITTLLTVLTVLVLAFLVIIPQIGVSLKTLASQIPGALRSMEQWLLALSAEHPELADALLQFDFSSLYGGYENLIAQFAEGLKVWTKEIVGFGVNAVGSVFGTITNFLIGFVFSIYLLLQKEKLHGQCRQILFALFSEQRAKKILEIAQLTNDTFSNFLAGQCIEAVLLGALFFIAMTLLQMPYALMIGVLIALTSLIPIVGAFIGCVIGAFMILIVAPMKALIFVILFLVLQQLEGNLIYPQVVGNSVGLPSLWVLAAVTVGGKLMGVVGMLIFIPLCSVLYALFRQFIKERLAYKGISKDLYAPMENTPTISCESNENRVE